MDCLNVLETTNCKFQSKSINHKVIWEISAIDRQYPMEISFTIPLIEISRFWHPTCNGDTSLPNLWTEPKVTKINYSMPVFALFNELGVNSVTISVSEALHPIKTLIGVHEEAATVHINFRLEKYRKDKVEIYFNFEKKEVFRTIENARQWLYKVNQINPLENTQNAWSSVYSTWYAFHQSLEQNTIESQLPFFKDYQMKTIILDDGWQTDDQSRRYAYAGDWNIAESKFPNMKEHIEKFHRHDISYVVWITLPYVGEKTDAYEIFKDKFLYFDHYQKAGIVDPRYPEVRKYLVEKLSQLINNYNLDGLKLDFIDQFCEKSYEIKEGMDLPSLEVAVGELLKEIKNVCIQFKQDFLIEFREDYFGPWMSEYGNILRVKDCPNDFNKNRVGITNLRLLCPSAAAHSDMIMFNKNDTLEMVALQIIHCIFGVVQLSIDFYKLSENQKKVISFWLGYQAKNFSTIFREDFIGLNPHNEYNVLAAGNQEKRIISCYQADTVLNINTTLDAKELDILNGTLSEVVRFSLMESGHRLYESTIYNISGDMIEHKVCVFNEMNSVRVPSGGFLRIKKIKEDY